MLFVTVKGTVNKFDLFYLLVQEKLQLSFYDCHTPEPKHLLYRRQAVAATERTAPAGFIIDNPVGKILRQIISEGNHIHIKNFL